MSLQYGELQPTTGWDHFVSLGTPGNFNGFRVLAALLHGTVVVGVSQTLQNWTEGATYIRQGGHHVGHWPTFLVVVWCVWACACSSSRWRAARCNITWRVYLTGTSSADTKAAGSRAACCVIDTTQAADVHDVVRQQQRWRRRRSCSNTPGVSLSVFMHVYTLSHGDVPDGKFYYRYPALAG